MMSTVEIRSTQKPLDRVYYALTGYKTIVVGLPDSIR